MSELVELVDLYYEAFDEERAEVEGDNKATTRELNPFSNTMSVDRTKYGTTYVSSIAEDCYLREARFQYFIPRLSTFIKDTIILAGQAKGGATASKMRNIRKNVPGMPVVAEIIVCLPLWRGEMRLIARIEYKGRFL